MPDVEILAYDETPLGTLCLRRRELLNEPGTIVTEVSLDQEFLMGSYNTVSERALADVGLRLRAGKDLDVLVGGLGLGYTVREALRSERIARLEVVELLPQIIEWLRKDLIPLAAELKADPRLAITQDDVYRRLAGPPAGLCDLILIDVDHSPEDRLAAGNAAFYTDRGLALAKRHLKPHGVLGVWSYAESSPFTDSLRRSFRDVGVEPVEFFNKFVGQAQIDWLFFARD